MPIPYRIHKLNNPRRALPGDSLPAACTLHGILKVDHADSQHLVYNEYVALRLGQALCIPVADGVLTMAGDGLAYASLESGLPGMDLPDALLSQLTMIAERYASDAAALVAFDLWIGNRNRDGNLKAAVLAPHPPVFRAFDHSRALLDAGDDADSSIRALESGSLIVESHPFYRRIDAAELQNWVRRIAAVDGDIVRDCCEFRYPFRAVRVVTQERLHQALLTRGRMLWDIVQAHAKLILP